MKRVNKSLIILLVFLVLGFAVRLYKINNPIADWHSWRQADTAAVARNFYQEGYNPFYPKGDDMSGIAENPVPNLGRFRFVEFPIYNSLVYFAYLANGGVNETLARIISVIISLGSIVFIYLITRRYFDEFTALTSALLYAILPYAIYYSRVILPEPSLVFFCLGMFYFTDRWIWENSTSTFIWSVIFTALAFLTKPMAIFYLLPLSYSYLKKEGQFWPVPLRYLKFLILSLLPFGLWRIWIEQHPEGIPASNWLLDGTHIRFKPAFWRWIIQDRFGREILTVSGTALLVIGLLKRSVGKNGYLLHFLAASSFLYLIVFATGNVQHDYYQTLIIPALVIFTARGFVLLLKGEDGFIPRLWTIPLSLLLLTLTIGLGWYEVSGLYQINNPDILVAGKEADKILPKDALVVAPYQGDTAFLYQINRHGFPVMTFSIEGMIKDFKVTHYVSVNYDDATNDIIKKYKVLEENPKFVIVDLRYPNNIASSTAKPK